MNGTTVKTENKGNSKFYFKIVCYLCPTIYEIKFCYVLKKTVRKIIIITMCKNNQIISVQLWVKI
jgi:hypothetical protein